MSERAEGFQKRREKVGEFEINIESYRIGDAYYCNVDNADPGAIVARGRGETREAAEKEAVDKAKERIGRTRKFDS